MRHVPTAAALIVLLLALVAEAGWLLHLPLLREVQTSWASMKPSTAACFGLLALSLLAQIRAGRWVTPGRVVSGCVGALATVTAAEYILGIRVGMDVLTGPRMASATAVTLALISAALTCASCVNRRQTLLALAALPPYVALVGYIIEVKGLYSFGPFGSVSLQTAIAGGLLCLGGLTMGESSWFQRIDVGVDPGAVLVRRMVPAGLVLFPALWLVGQIGSSQRWWIPSFAVALSVVGGSLFMVALVVWSAARLSELERQRLASAALADHDPLTGIGNRRYLDRALTRLAFGDSRAPRAALLAFDLDDFKGINDRFGHAEGDQTLRTFAQCVSAGVRPADIFVRTGGDEFALVLQDTSPAEARMVAENLLASVATWQADNPTRPAVSVGIAILDQDVTSAFDLEKRADLALYQAKRAGKRSISVYGVAAAPA